MKHNHPLSLNGGSPSQFTLTHEHDRGSEPHSHDVTPDGKAAVSTTFEDRHPDDALVRQIWYRKASGQDCTQDESAVLLRYFDRYPPDEAPPGSFAANVAELFPLELDQWYRETVTRQRQTDPGNSRFASQFDFPRLRKLVDGCVRSLNTLVVAHTKDGLDMPASMWKTIEEADYLINSVQDAIPVRTIVRYPAYIDVFVESDATGDNCRIVRTAATPQLSDAGVHDNAMPWVLLAESEAAGEQALEFTNDHVPWPDPKLEG